MFNMFKEFEQLKNTLQVRPMIKNLNEWPDASDCRLHPY